MPYDSANSTRRRISISSSEDDEDDDEEWLFNRPIKFPLYLEREYIMTAEDEENSRRKQEKFWRDYITTSIVYVSFLLALVTVTYVVKNLT